MSVNYHAFQSRGVLFSNHEVACRQWREEFADYNPARIQRILRLETDGENLCLAYFGHPYRLRLSDGVLEKQTEGNWTEELYFNEAMAIYHLLHFTKDFPMVSGKWVPGYTIDGVVSRNPAVQDPLLTPFEAEYAGRIEELLAACAAAGGKKIEGADAAYEFEAFPQVHIRLLFWDKEEDFPAHVQILVDQCVTDFIHYETIGCITADLLDRLRETG